MSALDLDRALALAADDSGRANVASVELWTVQSFAGSLVTVVNATQTLTFPLLRSYRVSGSSPVAGDVVLVLRAGSAGWVLGAFGSQPAAPTPPPIPPPSGGTTGSNTFLPTYTGTYRGGGAVTPPTYTKVIGRAEGVNTGAAFYGGAPKGLAGVEVTASSLHLTRSDGGANAATAPTLVLLGPGGTGSPPNIIASQAGPALTIGQSADTAIPTGWAGSLITGTAEGVGIYVPGASPYVQVRGRNGDAASMAVRIDWRRAA